MTDILGDYAALAEQWRAEREASIKATRADILPALQKLGVTEVTARYDGYGDSGNVEDVTVTPVEIDLPGDLKRKIADFAWSVAYHNHPGFENNEGGYGELTWDIGADSITLDHADRFIETSHSYHEGL